MTSSALRRNILATLMGTIAFLLMLLIGLPIIPAAPFLKYDPSGFVLLMSGALLGPAAGVLACFIKGFLFFITGAGNIFGVTSDFIANIVFVAPAALLLRKQGGLKGGIAACALGTRLATLVMIPVNLVILNLEFGKLPGEVMAMMLPAILPFNLLKGLFNSVLFFIAGRPLAAALGRHSRNGGWGIE